MFQVKICSFVSKFQKQDLQQESGKKAISKDFRTYWVWFFSTFMYPASTISFLVCSFNVNRSFFTYLYGKRLDFAYCFCKKGCIHFTSKFWGIYFFWKNSKEWFSDSTFNLLSNDMQHFPVPRKLRLLDFFTKKLVV